MKEFSFQRELKFGDCDPSGIAHVPCCLSILNGVIEEFWMTIGFPWRDMLARHIGTPTVQLDCRFSRPSFFGDLLTFDIAVRRVGPASLEFAHVVSGADGLRWEADHIVAAMSMVTRRAVTWPDDIREALVRATSPDPCAAPQSLPT